MTKVLVSDPIDHAGIDILSQVSQVDQRLGLSSNQLKEIIGDYEALMIRSGTQVNSEIIEAGVNLKIIGRAGVGVDNVDVPAATKRGVIVVNSPGGNTIAAAEHALALLLSLSRNIPQAHLSTISGKWDRKKFVGNELYKKILGVVGLGKIGSHVAKVANAMGMDVMAFDPFVSAERALQMQVRLSSIDDLFKEADFITLHLPRTSETENLVDAKLLSSMKQNARLVNCARGGIIDETALAEALNSNVIGGAALDVYSQEPLKNDSPLLNVKNNLILTPHLGASTAEAQQNVAIDVAEQIRDVLLGLPARSAVNIPGLSAEIMDSLKPHLQLAESLGLLASQVSGGQIQKIEVKLQGEFSQHPSQPLVIATLKGLLSSALGNRINYVNASLEAQGRGISVEEVKDEASPDFPGGSLQLRTFADKGTNSVTGTVLADGELRISSIDEFPINVSPSRYMLFTRHRDMPGIIGKLGSLLGTHNVNIAAMQVGRRIVRGEAVMVLSIDDPIPSELLTSILAVEGINQAHAVTF
ncbi:MULTISPECIES: phosphoglycerate dehydrogenase [Prochlorococcus]|uniref:D-3-phosphoglycerate dehydrogenase n=1 Tax=Prochlorococcus marinus (strain SARG / CCMP1375 / SS120) TaxID=167539 RepID=Q7VAM4_PROMA|nr:MULTISPECIES: phosphoglycerate dehydrogenase [Prochlorococcus]AAQ00480.1 D-3-phosphoglycerate dehydrogenase [Prochlorococcus marinus subsp. marinus str. CCMP1375]KGG14361.1 D-3-phosphoglycerate dehydrogenase [Prochlorococcus marinus str. LG]KGG22065.1 D-3-phosphoglycerate dehydrogenase [Prochlorococcus marinus str. SS2]KGG24617.1 D-3-phosphoglycerate dehydrogenase [Prochlorococcus marinus str. SS35]KGG33510.1 D-3-phosphoglycerate dehydrogenase [Prochlorococcus marinus str. SS51]